MTAFDKAGTIISSIHYKEHRLTLETSGADGAYYLESVLYEPDDEDGGPAEYTTSAPIHEVPSTKEEALFLMVNPLQEEIDDTIARYKKTEQANN